MALFQQFLTPSRSLLLFIFKIWSLDIPLKSKCFPVLQVVLRISLCKKKGVTSQIYSILSRYLVAYSSPSFQVLEVIQRVIRTILQKEKVMIIFHVLKKMRFPSVFCSEQPCIFTIFCLVSNHVQDMYYGNMGCQVFKGGMENQINVC